MTRETRLCPVCDSPLEPGAARCTQCKTDLSLFDLDEDGIPELDRAPAPTGKSIDEILESILSGKDVRPDFFEDIKTIARDGAEDEILGETSVEAGAEFECPSCGNPVAASARVCPGCGVQFAEEAIEQFECPLCSAVVDSDATSCPSCGVQFAAEPAPSAPEKPVRGSAPVTGDLASRVADPAGRPLAPSPRKRLASLVESRRTTPPATALDRETLFKELPRLVNDVKPLLLAAKRIGVEIAPEREMISDAIAHGKRRDVERAITLIREARFRLDGAFTNQLAKRIEGVLAEAETARGVAADRGTVVAMCISAIDALAVPDYVGAAERIRAAKESLDVRSGGAAEVRQTIAEVEGILSDSKTLGLTFGEADMFLGRCRSAMEEGDWSQAAGYAVQARQALLGRLPQALAGEMRKARNALLERKVRGGDLRKPVGILKQASIHMKREEYADAVRFVRMFREEVGAS